MIKKLGQNFLIDQQVAEREVAYAEMTKGDVVLEIGPGKGILTTKLAEKAKKVIAIEIDKQLIEHLYDIIPQNVELINNDALKVDFATLPTFNKIVSNLPFQISSPITFKFLKHKFDVAVLIYQKEFADRMVARPGSKDYSRLSVNTYYRAKCKILEKVPKNLFYPQPKVDSCMIELKPRTSPPFSVESESFFFELTNKLFNHRRKKIKTILCKIYGQLGRGVPYLNKRVEELNPEQIGELSDILVGL